MIERGSGMVRLRCDLCLRPACHLFTRRIASGLDIIELCAECEAMRQRALETANRVAKLRTATPPDPEE